ncbi:MAG TPA: hypothetical protein VK437_03890 [Steroidobacteraceae bacterium]|nr:hypothetical protein [Steroidobacteraceae bacterium]
MASDSAGSVSVIDFRRQSMVLQWHFLGGTWSAYDVPPSLVHGVALIRPAQPNICVFGAGGRLRLQVGPDQYALTEEAPRIKCTRGIAIFGLRRRFTVESATGGILFSHAYWSNQGEDFFRWLATRAEDPEWRATAGRRWSDGLSAPVLRAT